MKKLILIILISIYLPLQANCEPVDINDCDFTIDKPAEIYSLLDNGTIYKDEKTTGLLCYKDNRTTMYLPIKKGVPHGKVEFYFANGYKNMESPYKKGKAEGLRKWYYDNGKIHKEIIFKKGLIEGIAKIYYPNGNIKEINNYKKGKLEGISEMYYDDGKTLMIQGNFKNNLLDGIYRELYKNGKTKLKKDYKDGKLYSFIQEFDENGYMTLNRKVENGEPVANYTTYEYYKPEETQLKDLVKKETHWNGNFKNGLEKIYNEIGGLQEEIPWVNGVVDGVVKEYYKHEAFFNDTGKLKWEVPYKNGKKHGTEIGYYNTGEVETKINWINGKRDGNGAFQSFFKSGKIKQITNFKNDKEISEKVYYEEGQLKQDTVYTYKKNKQYETQTVYTEMGKVWGKINYVDGKITSATCGDGRKWTEAEKQNWVNKLSVSCSYPTK